MIEDLDFKIKTIQLLINLGLSEKEAELYLALIGSEKATITQVTKAAGVNRTSGYHILQRLVSVGLVRLAGKRPKRFYKLEPLEKIIELARGNLEDTKKRFILANSIIPQLKILYEKTKS